MRNYHWESIKYVFHNRSFVGEGGRGAFSQVQPMADPRGIARDPWGPISFIFMQFSAKILPNISFFAPNSGIGPHPLRLGNLGSATGGWLEKRVA